MSRMTKESPSFASWRLVWLILSRVALAVILLIPLLSHGSLSALLPGVLVAVPCAVFVMWVARRIGGPGWWREGPNSRDHSKK